MKKRWKRMKKLLVALGISLAATASVSTVTAQATELVEDGKSAILIEASTGEILYEKDAHQQLAPASMTKMMSMYLILEAINDESLAWDEVIRVSEHAASLGGSQIYLKPGEKMTVEDLFKSVAIASANDSVTALAERVAGSEEAFVELMNEKAKEFGMTNTTFKNPTGLTIEGHITTAYDMSLLARELLKFEEITTYTSMYEDYIREDTDSPFWLVTTNKLVKYVDGVDGLKTGMTEEAGYCLTATAKRQNMRVITVVMGGSTSAIRNAETTQLIEYAYGQYELAPQLATGDIVETKYNYLAKDQTYDVVLKDDLNVLKKKTETLLDGQYELTYHDEIELPIEAGEEIGELTYYYGGKEYQSIPVTVSETVEKNSFIGLFTHVLSQLLFGEDA